MHVDFFIAAALISISRVSSCFIAMPVFFAVSGSAAWVSVVDEFNFWTSAGYGLCFFLNYERALGLPETEG